jgi:hydrogenase expression/formation protein HypC
MIERLAAHGCITCGDEAIPMRVLAIDPERALALCSGPEGERCSVEIALVEPLAPGEVLLVHAGTALGRVTGPTPARVTGSMPARAAGPTPARAAEGAGSTALDATRREAPA